MYGFKGVGKHYLLSETTHWQHALRYCHAFEQLQSTSLPWNESFRMTIDILPFLSGRHAHNSPSIPGAGKSFDKIWKWLLQPAGLSSGGCPFKFCKFLLGA